MKLTKISKVGQPDLLIHPDAVGEHERLGWMVVGEEEYEPAPDDDEGSKDHGDDEAAEKAEKAEISETLKAMKAELPHHAAGIVKHREALAAATAGQP